MTWTELAIVRQAYAYADTLNAADLPAELVLTPEQIDTARACFDAAAEIIARQPAQDRAGVEEKLLLISAASKCIPRPKLRR